MSFCPSTIGETSLSESGRDAQIVPLDSGSGRTCHVPDALRVSTAWWRDTVPSLMTTSLSFALPRVISFASPLKVSARQRASNSLGGGGAVGSRTTRVCPSTLGADQVLAFHTSHGWPYRSRNASPSRAC